MYGSGIINDVILLNYCGGVSDALLLENNHMDPDNFEDPIQRLPCYQDALVFNNGWENIVGEVL